jgi:hypothetical protein
MGNTRKSPAALPLSLLLTAVLFAVVSSAAFAQAPLPAAPVKAVAQAPVTLNDIFAPAPTDAATKGTPTGRAGNYVIQNEKSIGLPSGSRHSFSHSLTHSNADICASGSCDCGSCSCYGTYDCCVAGCGACFAVACGVI